jgi:hypothetical protein
MGREKVGCCWPSAVIPHAAIMPPFASASNLDRNFSPGSTGSVANVHRTRPIVASNPTSDKAGRRTRVKKTTPSTHTKLGAQGIAKTACLPDSESGGTRGVRCAFTTPDIISTSSCCQGGGDLGNLGKADRTAHCCKAQYQKFDEITVNEFLFFQAKRQKQNTGRSFMVVRSTNNYLWPTQVLSFGCFQRRDRMPAERTIMRQVREVLRLKFVGGVPIREIARRIGVAASTVRATI